MDQIGPILTTEALTFIQQQCPKCLSVLEFQVGKDFGREVYEPKEVNCPNPRCDWKGQACWGLAWHVRRILNELTMGGIL